MTGECQNLASCAFFKEYENNDKLKLVLKGFISMYCKGDKQAKCVRRKLKKIKFLLFYF